MLTFFREKPVFYRVKSKTVFDTITNCFMELMFIEYKHEFEACSLNASPSSVHLKIYGYEANIFPQGYS